jgi:phospholipid/cholesterol/gamma-HCH transport system ATP-binding protein
MVLSRVCLDVPRGKTLVIMGRSGVGKSVLLRHIMGLEMPDSGTIEIDGVLMGEQSRQPKTMGHVGMLFQSSALFDSLSVGENVAFYLEHHDNPETKKPFDRASIAERVAVALAAVGLEGCADKMPAELSGGQKRRAALARLMIYRPSIILYDEPTTGLDPITAGQINTLINEAQKKLNATAIVVTHDVNSALAVGDLFAMHENGTLSDLSTKEELLRKPSKSFQDFFTSTRNYQYEQNG